MDQRNPIDVAKEAVEKAADKVVDKASEMITPDQPGRPSSETPSADEPTAPCEPLPLKPDQAGPEPQDASRQGAFQTTAQGARIRDSDHSLKVGRRGPVLIQDHHLREKITHFDHERIPERVVHARGAAAHGEFEAYGTASSVTHADFLQEGRRTQVFTRFSTVLGSRGSADTVRDTRGFATKFYTDEGTFDLVGNNMPVFFIQDGIKFPDIIHAGKPHPDREIPQAQSAHDTFWDFVSLHTEAQHHTLWNMSDRGIPRSFRMMEGFGIHTFRMVNADGETSLAKFHWKPALGVHSLVWEEAQLLGGMDPDFHRRDLADAIESGAFPVWELGLQVFPDTPEQTFEGIDLLDPTKIVPEELAPVQPVGRLTLNANPTNFFAETEQVAFHPGHLPPGIDVTDDPLLQVRLFSYIDTQITRLGGPSFAQLPINRPHAPVNDMLRDGFGQQGVHGGVAPYKPNSLDGGCPFFAGTDDDAFADLPVEVPAGVKERELSATFEDHFSQARLFWESMSGAEKEHIIAAYSFELNKCYEQAIKERQLQCLANIDPVLCAGVAESLGLPVPEPTEELAQVTPSPALSQVGDTWPPDGRTVGIVVDADDVAEELRVTRAGIAGRSMVPLVIAAHGGEVDGVPVQRTFATTRSVEYDALLLTGGGAGPVDPAVRLLVEECWRQAKAIGAWGDGVAVVERLGYAGEPGVVTGDHSDDVLAQVLGLVEAHRVWDRFPPSVG